MRSRTAGNRLSGVFVLLAAFCAICGCSRNQPGNSGKAASRRYEHEAVGMEVVAGDAGGQQAEYLYELGCVHLKYGVYGKAAACFEAAIKAAGESQNALYHWMLGRAYAGMGKKQEAAEQLGKAAAIYKQLLADHPERNTFYCLQLARIYAELGDGNAVVKWCGRIDVRTLPPPEVLDVLRLLSAVDKKATTLFVKQIIRGRGTEEGLLLAVANFLVGSGMKTQAEDVLKALVRGARDERVKTEAERLLARLRKNKGEEKSGDAKNREDKEAQEHSDTSSEPQ